MAKGRVKRYKKKKGKKRKIAALTGCSGGGRRVPVDTATCNTPSHATDSRRRCAVLTDRTVPGDGGDRAILLLPAVTMTTTRALFSRFLYDLKKKNGAPNNSHTHVAGTV